VVNPVLSVVVTSDYKQNRERSWSDERVALDALAGQSLNFPVEILLTVEVGERVPDTLAGRPGVRVIECATSKSAAQKLAAAKSATSELIGFIDSDCIPGEHWCQRLVEGFQARPDFSVITGRSFYPEHGLRNRILALLDRGDVDGGSACETNLLAANNFGIRRKVMLTYEPPVYPPVFNSRIFAQKLLREGHRIWFDPELVCIHGLSGWGMEADIRRNVGHAVIAQRRVDDSIEYAWAARLGLASVPLMVMARTVHEWRICIRHARNYGVRAHEVPLALALSVFLRLWELPGMLDAVKERTVPHTAYH